ncbi:alpha/beta fold hydrolase [Yoonia maritima]|uniref:alpha/beta fold hydrolase n=1 Tax=Yoonia maritima TaxID=1435347 RepID=UPI000D101B66|nr:alpha/beta hydrolase [Yoonia maritima]
MQNIMGHDIHADTVGEGSPALVLHCALGRSEAMMPLVQQLGYRATLFDLPGHGQSGNWDGASDYQRLSADVAAQLCDGPTHVIGHSFGATAALRLAVERPELVNRLTLIEPVYFVAAKGTDAHTEFAKGFRPFVAAMLRGEEDAAAKMFNEIWGGMPWDAMSDRRRQYLTERIHLVVAGAAEIEEDAAGITSEQRLGAVDIPVTLIRGGASQPVLADIHATLAARLPNATDHVVPGAGHMLPMTHADQVAEIIRSAD